MEAPESVMDRLDLSGDFYRSQDMTLASLSMPKDYNTSFAIMECLVELGCCQFIDNNKRMPEHLRRHRDDMLACADRERQMRLLVNEVNAFLEEDPDGTRQAAIFTAGDAEPDHGVEDHEPTFEALSERLEELVKDVLAKNDAIEKLALQVAVKREHKYVVEICTRYLQTAGVGKDEVRVDGEATQLQTMDPESGKRSVHHICGIVHTEKAEQLRKMLFRVGKGMIMTHIAPLQELLFDPVSRKKISKSIFVIWLTSDNLFQKAETLCKAYGCSLYDCPRMDMGEEILFLKEQELTEDHIAELQVVIDNTVDSCTGNFWEVGHSIELWKKVVLRHKVIYQNLNKCVLPTLNDKHTETVKESEYLQARVWMPSQCLPFVEEALKGLPSNPEDSAYLEELDVQEKDLPYPTYFATNKYTETCLALVAKYGVARYKEANPALFALSFFSFSFGVMFGDVLHGVFLLLFALTCIAFESRLSKIQSEMFEMPFSARYMIVMLGVCSIYMGVMYNELASIPVDLFGSSYHHVEGAITQEYSGRPYPVGLDPVWRWSGNAVMFTNSLKMKMAVIIGFCQMTFGVFLKLFNGLHGAVGDTRTVIHESIPELIIYIAPFGYLMLLIVVKWCTDWENVHQGLRGPPAILTTFINMAMFGEVQEKDVLLFPGTCERNYDPSTGLDDGTGVCVGQTILQRILIVSTVLCVPWLLLVRPLLIRADMQHTKDAGYVPLSSMDDFEAQDHALLHDENPTADKLNVASVEGGKEEEAEGASHAEEDEDHHSFANIIVHQCIHTIEYCLGTISNTASYLRLWALSLAHSQLSEVFWDYIFNGDQFNVGLNTGGHTLGIVAIVGCYFIWFGATMGVLMLMETLSAFLHALRLQWVEFQGKFYAADGVQFCPARFDMDVSGEED